jgi:O-antigen ligase
MIEVLEPDLGISPSTSSRGTNGIADTVLVVGLFAAIALSSIAFDIFDVETDSGLGKAILVAQRLSVYVPVVVGLSFGVPIFKTLGTRPLNLFLGAASWAIIASIFTDDPLGEFDRTLWFLTFVLLVAMVVVRFGWEKLLVLASIVGIALVGVGLVVHLTGWLEVGDVALFEPGLFNLERATGIAPQANAFGRSAAYLLLIGFILATDRRWKWSIPLGIISIGIAAPALLLSQSRFSALSAGLAIVLLLARTVRGARYFVALAIMGVSALIGLVLITGSLGSFARSDGADEVSSLLGRTAVWSEAADLTFEHPITGIGTEGLTRHYGDLEQSGHFGWDPTNAHNVVLQTSAAHGVIAAALVVLSLLMGGLAAARSARVGVFEVLVMFGVQGLVESILIGNPTLSAALLVGALATMAYEQVEP